ncbi:methyltransferase domain-containing protein [Solihabitans fulvus]|uniref:Methyltransferase domain-containing protein n=1 Tax=Solihabitans fulvus TaxID=1892852 RepID=A0A5B2WRP2_9PSEU|nr:methyltransferase domain-containing protein [Solihabitans fulvus]KAA2254653.1 methyltransferase domain-containing protein [Solihabitans fulvus]
MSITAEFFRHPLLTGAIAASSPQLAEAMTSDLGLERAKVVVELGPGTGAFTSAILDRMAPGARLVAVELNAVLAGELTRRFRGRPVEVVRGSAADLGNLVPDQVDAIVSGLPWTVMSEQQQHRILDAIGGVLTDSGRFTTFAYVHAAWTPPARRFAAQLAARFAVVARGPVVWPNLPPAFVHRAALPRVRAAHPSTVHPSTAA